MKKIAIFLLVIFLVAALAFVAQAEIPTPFAKIKEYALKGTYNGKVWEKTFQEEGSYTFGFLYCPKDKSIAIYSVTNDGVIGIMFHAGTFWELISQGLMAEISEKEAFEETFKIFRKMVELGLL